MSVALASTLFFSGLASADHSQTRKELEEIYAKRTQAIKEKNFDYLKSHESDDYTEKAKDGTVKNRQQADAETDELKAMVTEVKDYSINIDTIKEGKSKNEVIVETSDSGRMSFTTPDHKPHELFGRGRSRDVWRRTPQGWKLKYHEELESYVELDGKPIKEPSPKKYDNWARYTPEKCGLSVELPGEPELLKLPIPEDIIGRVYYMNFYLYDGGELVALVSHASGREPLTPKTLAEGFIKGIIRNPNVSDLSYSTEPSTVSRAPLKGTYKENGNVFEIDGIALRQEKHGWLVALVYNQTSQFARAAAQRSLASIKIDGQLCPERREVVGRERSSFQTLPALR